MPGPSSSVGSSPVPQGTGLLTGYYEPELRGAEAPGGAYQVPLHALPEAGPLRLLDRAAIEAGGLAGQRAGTRLGR